LLAITALLTALTTLTVDGALVSRGRTVDSERTTKARDGMIFAHNVGAGSGTTGFGDRLLGGSWRSGNIRVCEVNDDGSEEPHEHCSDGVVAHAPEVTFKVHASSSCVRTYLWLVACDAAAAARPRRRSMPRRDWGLVRAMAL
ncbi:hypothetical protein IWX92DRAFT_430391, partial [Phyllosticta citricarpa]